MLYFLCQCEKLHVTWSVELYYIMKYRSIRSTNRSIERVSLQLFLAIIIIRVKESRINDNIYYYLLLASRAFNISLLLFIVFFSNMRRNSGLP